MTKEYTQLTYLKKIEKVRKTKSQVLYSLYHLSRNKYTNLIYSCLAHVDLVVELVG